MKPSELFARCTDIKYTKLDAGVDVAVENSNGTLYIFFQDSDGRQDWKTNLDFPAEFYPLAGVYAHRGFLRSWKIAEGYLSHTISSSSGSIVCAGYSLGGALALLCHGYIWHKKPELRHFCTGFGFGAPRVLWGHKNEKTERIWQSFTVVRNLDDAITHLPPSALGYFHAGKVLEIGNSGAYGAFEAHKSDNILAELKKYEENTVTPT